MTSKVERPSGDKPKPPNAGKGRRKGVPNKTTAALKSAILEALDRAGGVTYLTAVAKKDPKAFLSLLGKLVPAEVRAELTGKGGQPLTIPVINVTIGAEPSPAP